MYFVSFPHCLPFQSTSCSRPCRNQLLVLLSRLHDCTPRKRMQCQVGPMPDMPVLLTRCIRLFAHRVPLPRGSLVHLALQRLGSYADAPLGVRVLPLQALRVAGRLPTSVQNRCIQHTSSLHCRNQDQSGSLHQLELLSCSCFCSCSSRCFHSCLCFSSHFSRLRSWSSCHLHLCRCCSLCSYSNACRSYTSFRPPSACVPSSYISAHLTLVFLFLREVYPVTSASFSCSRSTHLPTFSSSSSPVACLLVVSSVRSSVLSTRTLHVLMFCAVLSKCCPVHSVQDSCSCLSHHPLYVICFVSDFCRRSTVT